MIDISEMTPRDLDSIKDILCSEFDDFWNFNVLKKDFENPHTKYLVAKSNDCVVGFAGMLDTIDQFEITNMSDSELAPVAEGMSSDTEEANAGESEQPSLGHSVVVQRFSLCF